MNFTNRSNGGLVEDLYNHELDNSTNSKFISKNVFSKYVIDRLNLESELKGHDGCVNCLEWNQSGTILASGSDDLKIMLWNPFTKKLINTIDTKHRGNIFSVKFLPHTNDSLVASGAADRDIYVYDVNKNLNLNEIHSHQNRVKRLDTAHDTPFIFWSCGEDGFVLQHDIRCPSNSITSLLLDYRNNKHSKSGYFETKCLAINQAKSEYLAVGSNDPYARVYDRRMIKLRSLSNRSTQIASSVNSSTKCLFEYCLNSNDTLNNHTLNYYVPGHLPKRIEEYRKRMKTLSVTFVTFSPNGDELMVNLGGEQLYLFNIKNSSTNDFKLRYDSYKELFKDSILNLEDECNNNNNNSTAPSTSDEANHTSETKTDDSNYTKTSKKKYKLPLRAEEIKSKANSSFEQQNYVEAIEYYNQAIQMAPDSPILYGNRAAALMKRNWDGDLYAAMIDCYMALNLDNTHLKSHFRLARCLNELKWHQEANECLKIFCKRFPDYAKSSSCESLQKEIKKILDKLRSNNTSSSQEIKNEKLSKKRTLSDRSSRGSLYRYLSRPNDNDDEEDLEESESDDEDMREQDDSDKSESENDDIEDEEDECEDDDEDSEVEYETEEAADDDSGNSNSTTDHQNYCKQEKNNSKKSKKRGLKRSEYDIHNNSNKILNSDSKLTSGRARKSVKVKKIGTQTENYIQSKLNAFDFKYRYCGHCNVATDIKEANFLGENFLCAGSDDGSFFIWDRFTTNVVRVLKGDESIVNCIQPHPYTSLLATSGIDPHIRLWMPKFHEENENNIDDERIVTDVKSAAINNQIQMNSHPFEYLFLNLTQNAQNWDQDSDDSNQQSVACRPS